MAWSESHARVNMDISPSHTMASPTSQSGRSSGANSVAYKRFRKGTITFTLLRPEEIAIPPALWWLKVHAARRLDDRERKPLELCASNEPRIPHSSQRVHFMITFEIMVTCCHFAIALGNSQRCHFAIGPSRFWIPATPLLETVAARCGGRGLVLVALSVYSLYSR